MELPPLTRGRILKRYQRFLADVALDDGRQVTAHCPNTGAMTSCWRPGAPAELSHSDNPSRKLPWTLERIDMGRGWVGVNTARVNQVIAEGIRRERIPALTGYRSLRREPRVDWPPHAGSRLDLHLSDGPSATDTYVEVKNTTLLVGDSVQFPDAVTKRGRKHLVLLADIVKRCHRGVILFAVNRSEGRLFEPAGSIDPDYARTLQRVLEQGVEVVVVRLRHTATGIEVGGSVSYRHGR
jgi:sugar fermentation stimulation protein A